MNKKILKPDTKLIVTKNGQIVYETANIQGLYLYPLTILDYIYNIKNKKPIFLNIIAFSHELDYKEVLGSSVFEDLLCVELLLDNNVTNNDLAKAKDIISYLTIRKIKLSLNIKNLNLIDDDFIKENIKFIDYIKCFYHHINIDDYQKFLKKISIIDSNRKKDSLLHIKSYISEVDVINYEKRIMDFKQFHVNVYQVSKALLPLNKENISFAKNSERIIRKLEKVYKDLDDIKFISVKDLTTLYYPRFVLDDRNCKKCSACFLKPYLWKAYILPCKVDKVMNNMKQWGTTNHENLDKFSDYGSYCDDCASIFENDLLGFIRNSYLNGDYKFDIICGDNHD